MFSYVGESKEIVESGPVKRVFERKITFTKAKIYGFRFSWLDLATLSLFLR